MTGTGSDGRFRELGYRGTSWWLDPRQHSGGTHVEAGKSANLNILAGLGTHLVDETGDRELLLADPFLLDEDDVAKVGLEFSSDDLVDESFGFARRSNRVLELRSFRFDGLWIQR